MNATYIAIDLRRQVRAVTTILFTFLMPVLMYLLFGANTDYGDQIVGHGNVKFYVMSSMAAYGAVVAAVSVAAGAASESLLGWGRQISLTRASAASWVANKIVVALVIACVAQGLVFLAGRFTGAKADGWVWAATFAVSLAGAAIFAAWGIGASLLIKSDAGEGIASSAVVFFSFLGNVFTPLTGFMLTLAKLTPMYGYIGLVRWAQLEGEIVQSGPGDAPAPDSIWLLVASVVAWLAIFWVMAVVGLRRSRARR